MHFLPDLITRLRNAQRSNLQQRVFPTNFQIKKPRLQTRLDGIKIIQSTSIIRILEILQHEGFIRGFSLENNQLNLKNPFIVIHLKYNAEGRSPFTNISIISKTGRRIYLSSSALWQPRTSVGIIVLSTSQGMFTDHEARQKNLGGEILFSIS